MTPTAWNASRYPRTFALLRAAEVRKKASWPHPNKTQFWGTGGNGTALTLPRSHPAPILPSHRPMAKTMPPPMMTCTTVWTSGLFIK